MKQPLTDTIFALATPAGTGAIAVIRISGPKAFSIMEELFEKRKGQSLNIAKIKSHTLHFGLLKDGDDMIDEILISIFKKPHSYTAEDTVELSCHGSVYIQQRILQLLQKKGARPAQAGEFTLHAFLNGRMDLSQAEAVADLIATQDANAHRLALQQLRGGFSVEIKKLRESLIHFASLIELELDFAEEDVEFANRDELKKLIESLQHTVFHLLNSFQYGNVLKNGIPVVIAGKPNVGKSTLLNALLNEERAIVSEIPGTTRDVIEDEIVLEGLRFRFSDTAGIRYTEDVIEKIGVQRTYDQVVKSTIIIYLLDATNFNKTEVENEIDDFAIKLDSATQHLIIVLNKSDKTDIQQIKKQLPASALYISAKTRDGIESLKRNLIDQVKYTVTGDEVLVVNARHAAALQKANEEMLQVINAIDKKQTSDILAFHIRQSLHHLSEITGDIYTDDLLENIFSKFCIGK